MENEITELKLKYCPSCGKKTLTYPNRRHWVCSDCGFDLYNNVASAVGVLFIVTKKIEGKWSKMVLCTKRGKEPRKDFFGLPGGFVDPNESAEEACFRECREETGMEPTSVTYICSYQNTYWYKNIEYKTCDLFFVAQVSDTAVFEKLVPEDAEEIAAYQFFPVNTVDEIKAIPLAFPSAEQALLSWLKTQ